MQSGLYRARPSKRVWIPKADGLQRPISIAAVEDKIVQHAVIRVLNQIYEEDFLGFSYGFRPGRSRHNALDLWVNDWRKRRARGEVIIVRYADDFVMGFQYREEAEKPERLEA